MEVPAINARTGAGYFSSGICREITKEKAVPRKRNGRMAENPLSPKTHFQLTSVLLSNDRKIYRREKQKKRRKDTSRVPSSFPSRITCYPFCKIFLYGAGKMVVLPCRVPAIL